MQYPFEKTYQLQSMIMIICDVEYSFLSRLLTLANPVRRFQTYRPLLLATK